MNQPLKNNIGILSLLCNCGLSGEKNQSTYGEKITFKAILKSAFKVFAKFTSNLTGLLSSEMSLFTLNNCLYYIHLTILSYNLSLKVAFLKEL